MTGRLTTTQVSELLGMALLLFGGLVLAVYLLHRAFSKGRQAEPLDAKPPRPDDQKSFAMATIQGVIADLKRQQKELDEQRREAERRAAESSILHQIITREISTGVLVFDREGFLVMANPAARSLLGIDSWSRRRYSDLLGDESKLAARIRKSLQASETVRWDHVELQTARGALLTVRLVLAPYSDATTGASGVVCLLSKS